MKKILLTTECKKLLADVFTPVGIYLRLRDRFRDTILLESTDFHTSENSFSFIGINAIAGMEISSMKSVDFKLPGQNPQKMAITDVNEVPELLWDFMQRFDASEPVIKEGRFAQGLFGYTTYDAVQFFESIKLKAGSQLPTPGSELRTIPLMRYRLYQYVIAINHFKDELFICENKMAGLESELPVLESLIYSKDIPVYPFQSCGEERSNMQDQEYTDMVKRGIGSCHRGDVFQIVLCRRFEQKLLGD